MHRWLWLDGTTYAPYIAETLDKPSILAGACVRVRRGHTDCRGTLTDCPASSPFLLSNPDPNPNPNPYPLNPPPTPPPQNAGCSQQARQRGAGAVLRSMVANAREVGRGAVGQWGVAGGGGQGTWAAEAPATMRAGDARDGCTRIWVGSGMGGGSGMGARAFGWVAARPWWWVHARFFFFWGVGSGKAVVVASA